VTTISLQSTVHAVSYQQSNSKLIQNSVFTAVINVLRNNDWRAVSGLLQCTWNS